MGFRRPNTQWSMRYILFFLTRLKSLPKVYKEDLGLWKSDFIAEFPKLCQYDAMSWDPEKKLLAIKPDDGFHDWWVVFFVKLLVRQLIDPGG